jgi:hypothetical protein
MNKSFYWFSLDSLEFGPMLVIGSMLHFSLGGFAMDKFAADKFMAELNKERALMLSKIKITVNMYLDGKGRIMGYPDAESVLKGMQADFKRLSKWMDENDPGD